jgi:RimJ/RimL family protein N-acetyltransferase
MAMVQEAVRVVAPITIETPNYLMRTLTLDDATERWSVWFADAGVREALNMPNRPQTKADMQTYIRGFDQESKVLLGIFDKANGLLVGIFANYIDWKGRKFACNTVVGEAEYRSRGVMMEVTPPFRDYFFGRRGLKVMTATALSNNRAIRGYLEKTGWTLDHVLKAHVKSHSDGSLLDLCHYSITAEAWWAWKAVRNLPPSTTNI